MGSSSKDTPEQQRLPSPNLSKFPYLPKRLNRPNRPDRLVLPDVRQLPGPCKPRNLTTATPTSPPPKSHSKSSTPAARTLDPPGKRGEAELRTSFKETEKKYTSRPEVQLDGTMANSVKKLKGKAEEVGEDDGEGYERKEAGWHEQEGEARRQRDKLMRKMLPDKNLQEELRRLKTLK